MTNKTKQEELRSEIKGALFDLTDFSIYKFETQEATDEAYATVSEYEQDAIVAIEELISQQVLEVLAEVKSKKKVCDTFHSFGITKRIDAVPLSAIEEIESKYQ